MKDSELPELDIDHLGLVTGLIDELPLVKSINQRLGCHPYEMISAGHAVKAMLLNSLGSVDRGFRFLQDPLFLSSSVYLKSPRE